MRYYDYEFVIKLAAVLLIMYLFRLFYVKFTILNLEYMLNSHHDNGLITDDNYNDALPLIECYRKSHRHEDYLIAKNEIIRISKNT